MPAWSNAGPHRLGYSLKNTSERRSVIETSGLLPSPSEEIANPTPPLRRSRNMKLSRPDLQLSSGHPRFVGSVLDRMHKLGDKCAGKIRSVELNDDGPGGPGGLT